MLNKLLFYDAIWHKTIFFKIIKLKQEDMNKIHKLILVSIGASTLGLSGCASEHSKKGLNKTSKDVVLINEQKEIELSHHHQHQEKKSESFFTEQIIFENRKRYGNNHSVNNR